MSTEESILNKFTDHVYIQKSEIRSFLISMSPGLTELAFRKKLYSLEQKKILVPIGAGLYVLGSTSDKRIFIPELSNNTVALANLLVQKFPYTTYLVWETRQLQEFMIHQPAQNMIILEVEKDASEAVFNQVREASDQMLVLNPDQATYERYFMNKADIASILPMITKSPKQKIDGLVTARLEKMLVDLFVGENQFFYFQGSELKSIFKNAFAKYWVNPKILFRYATRRKSDKKLESYLIESINIAPNLIERV